MSNGGSDNKGSSNPDFNCWARERMSSSDRIAQQNQQNQQHNRETQNQHQPQQQRRHNFQNLEPNRVAAVLDHDLPRTNNLPERNSTTQDQRDRLTLQYNSSQQAQMTHNRATDQHQNQKNQVPADALDELFKSLWLMNYQIQQQENDGQLAQVERQGRQMAEQNQMQRETHNLIPCMDIFSNYENTNSVNQHVRQQELNPTQAGPSGWSVQNNRHLNTPNEFSGTFLPELSRALGFSYSGNTAHQHNANFTSTPSEANCTINEENLLQVLAILEDSIAPSMTDHENSFDGRNWPTASVSTAAPTSAPAELLPPSAFNNEVNLAYSANTIGLNNTVLSAAITGNNRSFENAGLNVTQPVALAARADNRHQNDTFNTLSRFPSEAGLGIRNFENASLNVTQSVEPAVRPVSQFQNDTVNTLSGFSADPGFGFQNVENAGLNAIQPVSSAVRSDNQYQNSTFNTLSGFPAESGLGFRTNWRNSTPLTRQQVPRPDEFTPAEHNALSLFPFALNSAMYRAPIVNTRQPPPIPQLVCTGQQVSSISRQPPIACHGFPSRDVSSSAPSTIQHDLRQDRRPADFSFRSRMNSSNGRNASLNPIGQSTRHQPYNPNHYQCAAHPAYKTRLYCLKDHKAICCVCAIKNIGVHEKCGWISPKRNTPKDGNERLANTKRIELIVEDVFNVMTSYRILNPVVNSPNLHIIFNSNFESCNGLSATSEVHELLNELNDLITTVSNYDGSHFEFYSKIFFCHRKLRYLPEFKNKIASITRSLRNRGNPLSPFVPLCRMVGAGSQDHIKLLRNEISHFCIEVNNIEGKPCEIQNVMFEVAVKEELTGTEIPVDIMPHPRQGIAEFTVNVIENGLYKISVMINDETLSGSPFPVLLYPKCELQLNISEQLTVGSENRLLKPWGACIDKDNNLYVADRDLDRIRVYNTNLTFKHCIGRTGDQFGQLRKPSGIALDKNQDLVVCDKDNHRIVVFDRSGNALRQSDGQLLIEFPWGVGVTSTNRYVVTHSKSRIIILSSNLIAFTHVSTPMSDFNPRGVCTGLFNEIYIAEFESGNIYRLDDQTATIKKCIESHQFMSSDVQKRPQGICVDHDGYFLIADSRNHRIEVYSGSHQFVDYWPLGGKPVSIVQISRNPKTYAIVFEEGEHCIAVYSADVLYNFSNHFENCSPGAGGWSLRSSNGGF